MQGSMNKRADSFRWEHIHTALPASMAGMVSLGFRKAWEAEAFVRWAASPQLETHT
jgi:hypothetical protein